MPLPLPDPILTPVESLFGKALIAYLSSDANTFTNYLRSKTKFIQAHPIEKAVPPAGKALAVLSLVVGRERYETQALIDFTFGLAFYSSDQILLRSLQENTAGAIQFRQRNNIQMTGQRVVMLKAGKRMPIVFDRDSGLKLTEIELLVRLASN